MVTAEEHRVPRLAVVRRPGQRRGTGAGRDHAGDDLGHQVGQVDERDDDTVVR